MASSKVIGIAKGLKRYEAPNQLMESRTELAEMGWAETIHLITKRKNTPEAPGRIHPPK